MLQSLNRMGTIIYPIAPLLILILLAFILYNWSAPLFSFAHHLVSIEGLPKVLCERDTWARAHSIPVRRLEGRLLVRTILLSLGLLVLGARGPLMAQKATSEPAGEEATSEPEAEEAMVQLNFPAEIELQGLVDYVSQRLGVKILYDEQVSNKKISIKAPGEVPASSLLGVLQSALKMKNLALVDAGVPGWKRIVTVQNLQTIAPAGEAKEVIEKFGADTAVTQTFVVGHAAVEQLDQLVKPFLTQPGANSVVVPEAGILIVTDYASNLLKIAKLVELIDRPKADVVLEFYKVHHVEASELAAQASELLTARSRAQGRGAGSPAVEVTNDDRTNQLVLVGTRTEVDDVLKLIDSLDVPLGLATKVHSFEHVSAERIDRLVKELVDPITAKRLYKSAVDAEQNMLVVTATPEIQERVESLKKSMDVPGAARTQSPMRLYKLENVTAVELMATLQSIIGEQGLSGGSAYLVPDERVRTYGDWYVPGPNRPPPLLRTAPGRTRTRLPEPAGPGPTLAVPPLRQVLPTPPAVREEPGAEAQFLEPTSDVQVPTLPGGARVTADANSNTLIVVADPAVQRAYEDLIRQLDRRRPQVQIEAKLIILDTSDNFSLGVEVSTGDSTGARRLFGFSSFGLSAVDPLTGALALIPGPGLNGTLVDPDTADVVVRALATHRRAKVLSAPRVLVNDNATGVLTSVAEVPFTSVNASQTVATTSFAGFAEAGTTITVTPHISEGDHLQLEFTVTLNTFTGTPTDGVPPPRQTDEVDSQVTIPDGHTVIVGGLNRKDQSKMVTGIPFIENVPLLKYISSSRNLNSNSSSLFIFLRPVILRDDKFKDLKFLSERDAKSACIPGQFPASEPLLMK